MFQEHLKKSIGVKDFEILEYQNNNEFSLAQIYNRGISESKFNIVVCIHNDIKLETGWGKKLLQDFENSPDFAIIGKAGSCYFPKSGIYWERMQQTMVGQVYHHPDGQKKWLSKYSAKLPYLIPVVTIDGLFISFDKDKIKHTFDESIGKFHFYDHGFCVPNYLDGIKIGVTSSFDITHQSVGRPNQEFFESKDKFLEKYQSILPLDLKPEKIFVQEIKEKPLKNIGKVAVVILTKSKVEMLYECVKSFYDNCNPKIFDVFIGDTGSTDEEKKWIKENILPLGNVNLIEYDYYNFSKNNNDIVKNYLTDSYEFILFSNNDIKILNNVIFSMLNVFKNNFRTGTVGARLHFEDNTTQHCGVRVIIHGNNKFLDVENIDRFSYFNYPLNVSNVFGNTGALLMIRKDVFNKCGQFNENYKYCFEDAELNLKTLLLGYENFCDNQSVAYHYESKTRPADKTKEDSVKDYNENFLPLLKNNFEKVKNKIFVTK
jgi:GT2 family glycosyltransferase